MFASFREGGAIVVSNCRSSLRFSRVYWHLRGFFVFAEANLVQKRELYRVLKDRGRRALRGGASDGVGMGSVGGRHGRGGSDFVVAYDARIDGDAERADCGGQDRVAAVARRGTARSLFDARDLLEV